MAASSLLEARQMCDGKVLKAVTMEPTEPLGPDPTKGAKLCNRGRSRLSRPPRLRGESGEPQYRRVQQSARHRPQPVEERPSGLDDWGRVWEGRSPSQWSKEEEALWAACKASPEN